MYHVKPPKLFYRRFAMRLIYNLCEVIKINFNKTLFTTIHNKGNFIDV